MYMTFRCQTIINVGFVHQLALLGPFLASAYSAGTFDGDAAYQKSNNMSRYVATHWCTERGGVVCYYTAPCVL